MEYAIGVLNKIISDLKTQIEALEWHKSKYGLDYPKDFYLDKIKDIEQAIDILKNNKK